MHCTPITTAPRKKQRIRLTNSGQRQSAATNDGRSCSRIRAYAAPKTAFTQEDLAVFSASKKRVWHRHFFQRLVQSQHRRARTSATQMEGAMMRRIGPPPVAWRTKKFSTVGRSDDARAKKSSSNERITAGDSRRETRSRTCRARQNDDIDASSAADSHTPSLRLSNSLTACGLARPPDARLT